MLRLRSLLIDLDLRGSRVGGLGLIVENNTGGSTSSFVSVFSLEVILPVVECASLVVAMGVGVPVITVVVGVSVVTGAVEVSIDTGGVEMSVVTGGVEMSVVTGGVEVSVVTGVVEVSVVTGVVEVIVGAGVEEVSLSLYSKGGGILSG